MITTTIYNPVFHLAVITDVTLVTVPVETVDSFADFVTEPPATCNEPSSVP